MTGERSSGMHKPEQSTSLKMLTMPNKHIKLTQLLPMRMETPIGGSPS